MPNNAKSPRKADSSQTTLRKRSTSKKKELKVEESKAEDILDELVDDDDDDDDDDSKVNGLRVNSSAPPVDKLIKKPFAWKNFFIRGVTGVTLIGALYGILSLGHLYCILFIVLLQTELYRELVNVRYVAAKEYDIPLFRSIQWGWFIVPMFFVCKFALTFSHFVGLPSY
jgi:hypothetical protein